MLNEKREEIRKYLSDISKNWYLDFSKAKPFNVNDFAKGIAESYTKLARERYDKDDIVVKTNVKDDNSIGIAIENPPLEMLVDMAETGIDFDMSESKVVRQELYVDSDMKSEDLGF